MKELTSERMKENNIYISVVIPLYNKQNAITATLQSVLTQTYTNFEVIVVDDGSTDDSANVAEAVLRECTVYGVECKGKVIRKANGGVCSARNRGIHEAKYDYIALLDGDDLWDEHYLEEQVKLIQDFPEAKMWGVNYADIYNGKIIPYQQGVADDFRGYVQNYFGTKHGDLFWTSAVVIDKSVFSIVGFFDERIAYSEDMDMWYRIILKEKVAYHNKVLTFYNKDAENRAEGDLTVHFDIYKCLDYYIDKYVPYFAENKNFSRFINLYVVWNILGKNYYWGNDYDRRATDKIVSYLDFSILPWKYYVIFKSPRCIGKCIYKLSKLIQKFK